MSTIGKRYLFLNARGGLSIADESGIAGNYATEADAHTVAAHDAAVERLDFNAAIDLSYLYLDESERQMELHEPGIAARWNEMAEQLHDWASHRSCLPHAIWHLSALRIPCPLWRRENPLARLSRQNGRHVLFRPRRGPHRGALCLRVRHNV